MFTEIGYRKGRSPAQRVVAKAERIEGTENPRYAVTSLSPEEWKLRELYEQLYCARVEMENRIKEQRSLFAARMSAETMHANQLRLYLSAAAYVLLEAMRRLALAGTGMARAQVKTIRLRLLKIGARIWFSERHVLMSTSSGYAWQGLLSQAWVALRC
ncbi:MAG: transposase [Acidobacteriota bacterium]